MRLNKQLKVLRNMQRRLTKACVVWVLMAAVLNTSLWGGSVEMLKITVLEGEGAFNDVKRGTAHNPVVVVQDQDNEPVAGAQVTFTLPSLGQGGVFAQNQRTFSTTTDHAGRARTMGFRANSVEGSFDIQVQASYQGTSASTLIPQSNTSAIVRSGGASRKLLLLGIGGAIAGGVLGVMLTRGGSSSTPAPAAPPTVITGGSVSVGGPR